MRTSPYNIDLRKKVIKYIELGNSQQSASKVFMLNPSTVNRWWLRYKREGNFSAKKRLGKAPRVSALLIHDYVKTHPNCTSAEMGTHFGMTSGGAFYWLKKLGYSYKKKPLPTWNLKKQSGKNMKK